jgi:hypothetical protein
MDILHLTHVGADIQINGILEEYVLEMKDNLSGDCLGDE